MAKIFHPSFNTLSKVSIFGAVFFLGAGVWAWDMLLRSPYNTQVNVANGGLPPATGEAPGRPALAPLERDATTPRWAESTPVHGANLLIRWGELRSRRRGRGSRDGKD